jgi:hypothetical protein
MMARPNPTAAGKPDSGHLALKLGALFLGTIAVVFFGTWIYDLFNSYRESREAENNVVTQPQPIVIDPKIQSDLARVLSYESAPADLDIRDPFNDRANLSQTVSGTITSGTASQSTSGGSTSASTGGQGTPSVTVPGNPNAPSVAAVESPSDATRRRYLEWLERAQNDPNLQLDPQLFAIDDLLPVGVVSGGNGRDEVIFFSQVAERTWSFPVGTRFYDGWFTDLRPEGVVFSFNDPQRTVRLRSWGRSIKQRSGFFAPAAFGPNGFIGSVFS